MAIHPALESVGQLFLVNHIFRVPPFQRYYAWDAEQIGDFLNDLELCLKDRAAGKQRAHFFGGLVTARTDVVGSSRQNMEIIDGQQRVASFSMLAAQLRNAVVRLARVVDEHAADNPKKFLLDFADKLRNTYERYQDKINLQVVDIDRLELSNPDRTYFKDLMTGQAPAPSRQSHRLLKQAWEKIGAKLSELVADQPSDIEKAKILSLVDTVMQDDWNLIHMVTDSKDEALRLFRVLNDRGTGLTEGELLRSQLLEAVDGVAIQKQKETIEQTWDQILGADPDAVDVQLRTLFASITGKRAGKSTLLDEFKENIFEEIAVPMTPAGVKTIIKKVEDLKSQIDVLVKLQGGDWPYPSNSKSTAWDRSRLGLLIGELKHTNCLPLLLSATQLPEAQFAAIVQILERFMFRYKVVANAHIGAATNVYHAQSVQIRKAKSKYKIQSLRNDLQALLDKSANDEDFRLGLTKITYSRTLTNKPLKYLLITLESYLRWYRKGAAGQPVCLDKMVVFDPSATTIEHIYAENASTASPQMSPIADTLGNLTLLGSSDNDAAGNKPFSKKKLIFAKSALLMNRELGKRPTWTAVAVAKRQKDLEEVALKIFRLV